jgi:predicted transcriptional regulator
MDAAPDRRSRAPVTRIEGVVEKRRRLAREAEMIAEADADIAAGRLVGSAAVDAWIDSIGTDHELPVPGVGN